MIFEQDAKFTFKRKDSAGHNKGIGVLTAGAIINKTPLEQDILVTVEGYELGATVVEFEPYVAPAAPAALPAQAKSQPLSLTLAVHPASADAPIGESGRFDLGDLGDSFYKLLQTDPGSFFPSVGLDNVGKIAIVAYQAGTRVVEFWCLEKPVTAAKPLIAANASVTITYQGQTDGSYEKPVLPSWTQQVVTMVWAPPTAS